MLIIVVTPGIIDSTLSLRCLRSAVPVVLHPVTVVVPSDTSQTQWVATLSSDKSTVPQIS